MRYLAASATGAVLAVLIVLIAAVMRHNDAVERACQLHVAPPIDCPATPGLLKTPAVFRATKT